MKAFKLDISGKVQGVFYRANACFKAKELMINGSVCNTPDGNVQIMAEGDDKNLEAFIDWCYKGPLLAQVVEIRIEPIDFVGFNSFLILK